MHREIKSMLKFFWPVIAWAVFGAVISFLGGL